MASSAARAASGFRLERYFIVTSLAAFLLVAAALVYFQREEGEFFKQVQKEQSLFFRQVQASNTKDQDESARRDLLTTHEAGSVNLTRLFANALWEKDFAPFVAKAQQLSAEHCRAIPDVKEANGKSAAPPAKKACFAEVGAKIMAFPEFRALDTKVAEAMNKSSVFKIKVYDLRGITVYSSQHSQIGEDKFDNRGWKSAAGGKPASQLSHRDTFGAFEGVVVNRDLIESYVPVWAPGGDRIVGVFEVYSDVTPFLEQIKSTSAKIAKLSAANQARVDQAAAENQEKVEARGNLLLAIVGGLLALLYAALYLVVRNGQRIIDRQEHDREHAQQQLAQSGKMAALGQMVAGVAHQLNTPLAFSHSNVSLVIEQLKEIETPVRVASKFTEIVRKTPGEHVVLNLARARKQLEANQTRPEDVGMMREMLNDVLTGIDQMSQLVVHMRDFTRLDRAKVAEFDVNHGLRTVAYVARSVIPNRVRLVEEFGDVPRIVCNPSQLNQVFLNLINNASQAIEGNGTITIRTGTEGDRVKIEVIDTGSGISPEVREHIFETYFTTKAAGEGSGMGLSIALDVVKSHGGDIEVKSEVGAGSTFTVYLPVDAAPELAKAA